MTADHALSHPFLADFYSEGKSHIYMHNYTYAYTEIHRNECEIII